MTIAEWSMCYLKLGLVAVLSIVLCLRVAAPATAQERQPERLHLVFEDTENRPRYLGQGTAIDWERPGLTLELLRLVGDRLGVAIHYDRMPWRRGLYLMRLNDVDGIFHASYVAEREEIGVYPMRDGEPDVARQVFTQSYMIYTLKDAPLQWDGVRFTGDDRPIGAEIGYSVVADLKALGAPVEEARTQVINLQKLLNGRIAGYVSLENMVDVHIGRDAALAAAIIKRPLPVKRKPYYLIFAHGFYERYGAFAERFWDTIADVNASPDFADLVVRYSK